MPALRTKKVVQVKAKVITNTAVMPPYHKIVVEAPFIARTAQPGQFVNVRVSEKYTPLLRRPLGIHRVTTPKVELLYEVVGLGTLILSQRKPGERLDILGPLGRGFTLQPFHDDTQPLLVAGGMGVAPLVFLAEKLAAARLKSPASKIKVLLGAKTKQQLLCEAEFRRAGCEVKVATDDGSRGFQGYVSGLLQKELAAMNYSPCAIFACGPRPMLAAVARIACERHIPSQVSLEEHMACGVGFCFGCVVATNDGYARVCKDGPVFDAAAVVW